MDGIQKSISKMAQFSCHEERVVDLIQSLNGWNFLVCTVFQLPCDDARLDKTIRSFFYQRLFVTNRFALKVVLDGIVTLFPEHVPVPQQFRRKEEVMKLLDNILTERVNLHDLNELASLLSGLLATCQLRSASMSVSNISKNHTIFASFDCKVDYRGSLNKYFMSNHKKIVLQIDKLAQTNIFADLDLLMCFQLIMVSKFSVSSLKSVRNIFSNVLKLHAVEINDIFNSLKIDLSHQHFESMCNVFHDKRNVEAFQSDIFQSFSSVSYADVSAAVKQIFVYQLTVKKFQCLYLTWVLNSMSTHNVQIESLFDKLCADVLYLSWILCADSTFSVGSKELFQNVDTMIRDSDATWINFSNCVVSQTQSLNSDTSLWYNFWNSLNEVKKSVSLFEALVFFRPSPISPFIQFLSGLNQFSYVLRGASIIALSNVNSTSYVGFLFEQRLSLLCSISIFYEYCRQYSVGLIKSESFGKLEDILLNFSTAFCDNSIDLSMIAGFEGNEQQYLHSVYASCHNLKTQDNWKIDDGLALMKESFTRFNGGYTLSLIFKAQFVSSSNLENFITENVKLLDTLHIIDQLEFCSEYFYRFRRVIPKSVVSSIATKYSMQSLNIVNQMLGLSMCEEVEKHIRIVKIAMLFNIFELFLDDDKLVDALTVLQEIVAVDNSPIGSCDKWQECFRRLLIRSCNIGQVHWLKSFVETESNTDLLKFIVSTLEDLVTLNPNQILIPTNFGSNLFESFIALLLCLNDSQAICRISWKMIKALKSRQSSSLSQILRICVLLLSVMESMHMDSFIADAQVDSGTHSLNLTTKQDIIYLFLVVKLRIKLSMDFSIGDYTVLSCSIKQGYLSESMNLLIYLRLTKDICVSYCETVDDSVLDNVDSLMSDIFNMIAVISLTNSEVQTDSSHYTLNNYENIDLLSDILSTISSIACRSTRNEVNTLCWREAVKISHSATTISAIHTKTMIRNIGDIEYAVPSCTLDLFLEYGCVELLLEWLSNVDDFRHILHYFPTRSLDKLLLHVIRSQDELNQGSVHDRLMYFLERSFKEEYLHENGN